MNFYILTFKKKIFLIFFLLFLSFILLNLAISFYANKMTTKNSFIIGIKDSQTKYFELNNFYDKDIIFIGSSRTFYHISTNMFKNNGIDIFNFGLSGNQLEDYPSIINTISKYNPKKVVISLSVNRLYEDLNKFKNPTLTELNYIWNIDKNLFFDAFKTYILGFNTFFTYSESIFYKITSFYNKFTPMNKDLVSNDKFIKDNDIKIDLDCDIYDIKLNTNGSKNIKCTNGDGILIGNSIKEDLKQTLELNYLNRNAVSYMNEGILNPLIEKNIEVIIILEPIFHNYNKYDIEEIKKYFKNIKIIDLTNLYLKDENWSDNGHLNRDCSKICVNLVK